MRPTDAQIRAGLTHPEKVVRKHALNYFSHGFVPDPEAMAKAIEAVETFGWDHAFEFASPMGHLSQTEDTLRWLLEEMKRVGEPQSTKQANRQQVLARIINSVDVDLLRRHESEVMGLTGEVWEFGHAIAERLRLAEEPAEQLWAKLEAFCEREKDTQYVDRMDLPHAYRVAEAASREPSLAPRVLEWVALDAEAEEGGLAGLQEGIGVRLAGLMHLQEAVPLIVNKLRIDTDWLREECEQALGRIGGDEVVARLSELFPDSSWDCRLYATGAFFRLRTETACDRCLNLAESEEHPDLRANLVHVALDNFDTRGVEPARSLAGELCAPAVAVSLLTGEAFPERDAWLVDERAHERRRRQRLREMRGEATDPFLEADLNQLFEPADAEPVQPVVGGRKPGRNEPCPCGSGKKYKKCCMGVEAGR